MEICQSLVIKPHQVEDGGVQVVQMNFVFYRFKSKFVGGAMGNAAFYSATRHPHGKPVRVVVASWRTGAFTERHAPKFPSPYD